MPKKANLEDLDELRKRPGKIGQQSLIASRIHVQRRIDYSHVKATQEQIKELLSVLYILQNSAAVLRFCHLTWCDYFSDAIFVCVWYILAVGNCVP